MKDRKFFQDLFLSGLETPPIADRYLTHNSGLKFKDAPPSEIKSFSRISASVKFEISHFFAGRNKRDQKKQRGDIAATALRRARRAAFIAFKQGGWDTGKIELVAVAIVEEFGARAKLALKWLDSAVNHRVAVCYCK